MSFRTEDGKFRIPQEISTPPVNDLIKRPEYWRRKTLHTGGQKRYFDQDIRTGECYLCKRMGDAQRSRVTQLHHLKYWNDDILRWTIEVCSVCHIRIDERLQRKLDVTNYKKRRRREEYERRMREPVYFKIGGVRYSPEEARYLYGIRSGFH